MCSLLLITFFKLFTNGLDVSKELLIGFTYSISGLLCNSFGFTYSISGYLTGSLGKKSVKGMDLYYSVAFTEPLRVSSSFSSTKSVFTGETMLSIAFLTGDSLDERI
jgi:hypothetical protein